MTEYCYLLRANHYYDGPGWPIAVALSLTRAKLLARSYLFNAVKEEGIEWKGRMLSWEYDNQWMVCCDKISKLVHIDKVPVDEIEDL